MADIEIRRSPLQPQIGHIFRAALCGGVVELNAIKRVAERIKAV